MTSTGKPPEVRHRRRIRIFLPAALLAAAVAKPAAASASETRAVVQPAEPPIRQADRSFADGLWLYADGDLSGALARFRRAHALFPDFRVLYNIAGLMRELEDWAGALRTYRRYLAKGGELVPAERRAHVERVVAELAQKVGRIQVEADGGKAELFVDDEPFALTSVEQAVEVNPGRRRVRVTNPRIPVQTRTIEIASGERVRLVFDTVLVPVAVVPKAAPVPRPAPPPVRRDPR
jgi:tetratricopeptide (TPR) repeat protein